MELGLNGKIALVCAASKGLGYAVAERLAREKARVAILARDSVVLEEACQRLQRDTQGEIFAVSADVADDAQMRRALDAVTERFGAPDILVLNAGGPAPGVFTALREEDWQNAFNLNLMSAVRLIRRALPAMKERRQGAILFMTSISVKQPLPNMMLSNSLRAAVTGMSRTLADEVAPFHIRVNALGPGYFRTDRMEQVIRAQAEKRGVPYEEQLAALADLIPLGRLGEPREFADFAAFLVSERASYVTGGAFWIDGGLYRGLM